MGTCRRAHLANAGAHRREGHDIETGLPGAEQGGAGCEVDIDGVCEDGRDAHGWRCDDEWDFEVMCGDQLGSAYEQFPMMAVGNLLTNAGLEFATEALQVEGVDAAIHEAKAVRGADDGLAIQIENRALVDLDEVEVAAELLPCQGLRFVEGCQN